jgi:hypothetical protein
MELDESSGALVENGLLVVIEFNRTRVLVSSEVGDEDSAASSDAFRFDLRFRGFTLTCKSSDTL